MQFYTATFLHFIAGADTLYTVEGFINEHTLYPFLIPFLSSDRLAYILSRVSEKKGAPHHGFGKETHPLSQLKYCPECLSLEICNYGEPYLHRFHQIPGVLICHNHGIPLKIVTKKQPYNLIEYSTRLHDKLPDIGQDNIRRLKTYYSDVELLLATKRGFDPITTVALYIEKMKYLGYATWKGQVNIAKLEEDFIKHYSYTFLGLMGSDLNTQADANWLRKCFCHSRKKTIFPVRHLLLIRFFFGSFKEFLDYKFPRWSLASFKAPYKSLQGKFD